jgi:hypothetical protein
LNGAGVQVSGFLDGSLNIWLSGVRKFTVLNAVTI